VMLVQVTGELTVLPAVTSVPLHHSAMDTCTDCSVVSTGEGKSRFCLQLQQYCYITVIWIQGLTALMLVHCRGEIAVLRAVTSVLLHYSAFDAWNNCSVVSTGQRENGGSAFNYCSTVTSLCYGYID